MTGKFFLYLFAACMCISTGCKKDKNTTCDASLIINAAEEETTLADQLYEIRSAQINGNCLKIDFQTGGCTDNVEANLYLVDLSSLAGATEENRNAPAALRLVVIPDSFCAMLIHKSKSFDLSALREFSSTRPIKIHLEGWEQELEYH